MAKKLIHHSFLIFAVHRYYQRIRPNLWQISWVEETGTIVTMALDQEEKRVTTAMFFSYGASRCDQSTYRSPATQIYEGRGDLEDIEMDWPTL